MINLAAVGSASGAGEYYSQDNYYTTSELTEASEWFGRGAEALGLQGAVEEQAFVDVLSGKLPDGSEIPAVHGEHRPGVDMTFSAPKSVSLLALIGQRRSDRRCLSRFRHRNAGMGGEEPDRSARRGIRQRRCRWSKRPAT
jgi:conjugative relaxase-like TrwC/TraI family protein